MSTATPLRRGASTLVAILLGASAASAGDKAACLDASLASQALRNSHHLVEARERLRVCADPSCPSIVSSDCAMWLAEVERALPSVVVSAKSGAGADLVDVKVSVDGKPFLSSLDGQARPLNAGPHTFHFEPASGPGRDQQVVVREGEKSQAIAVVFALLGEPGPRADAPVVESGTSSLWRSVGWVLGGVGVVGLGVGAVFGILAAGDKGSDCTGSACKAGTLGGIKDDARLSDVGLIAGGVLLAGGAALVIWGPGPSPTGALGDQGVRVAPTLTAGGGGVVAVGSW